MIYRTMPFLPQIINSILIIQKIRISKFYASFFIYFYFLTDLLDIAIYNVLYKKMKKRTIFNFYFYKWGFAGRLVLERGNPSIGVGELPEILSGKGAE